MTFRDVRLPSRDLSPIPEGAAWYSVSIEKAAENFIVKRLQR